MDNRLSRIEDKIDQLVDRISDVTLQQESRLTRLETHQRGFFTIISALWVLLTASVGVIMKKLHWG